MVKKNGGTPTNYACFIFGNFIEYFGFSLFYVTVYEIPFSVRVVCFCLLLYLFEICEFEGESIIF